MIRAAGAGDQDFLDACTLDPVFGAQVHTEYAVYGETTSRGWHGGREADFWVALAADGSPAAALSLMDGRLSIASSGLLDLEEMTAFIRGIAIPCTVHGQLNLCKALCLDRHLTFGLILSHDRIDYCDHSTVISTDIVLDELYQILASAFQEFRLLTDYGKWVSFTSHVFRHNLGFVAGIRENGALVSTAGVYASSESCGVISNVATEHAYRGRGYAGLLVQYLCGRLVKAGKIPALLCADEGLVRYYKGLGFKETGRWGQVVLEREYQQ